MGSKINQISYYLPSKILTNNEMEQMFPEWNASKIEEKIGIRERHIVSEDETALDLGCEAAKKLFVNFDKSQIDFILFCTQSPDYFLPSTACLLQQKLELRTDIGAIDFNLGCSGFIYGLSIAKGLIHTGVAKNVLLVTSETYSKHIHPNDKANRSIFGDGAAATVISYSENEKIFEFTLGTDGSGQNNLIVPTGGMRKKNIPDGKVWIDDGGNFSSDNNLFMNGPEIFNFTIESIPSVIQNALVKNNTTIDNIDYFIFHQANKFMLDYLRKKIKIPREKFYNNLLTTGNTVSSTIPIALKDSINNSIVKSEDKVLLCGFGVGYSWGATVIKI